MFPLLFPVVVDWNELRIWGLGVRISPGAPKISNLAALVLLPIVDERRLWAAVLIQAVRDVGGWHW